MQDEPEIICAALKVRKDLKKDGTFQKKTGKTSGLPI